MSLRRGTTVFGFLCLVLAAEVWGASVGDSLLKGFRRGANLGNYLEAPAGANWGAKYSEKDFSNIKSEGFDHVRVPVAWHHYTGPGPEFKIAPEIFSKVDFL